MPCKNYTGATSMRKSGGIFTTQFGQQLYDVAEKEFCCVDISNPKYSVYVIIHILNIFTVWRGQPYSV